MTEDIAKSISTLLSNGFSWAEIHTFSPFTGEYKNPDALRLAYNRATGKYKDERKRHDQPKFPDRILNMRDNPCEENDSFFPTHTLAEVKEELGLNDRESVEWNKDGTQTSEKTTTINLDLRNERDLLLYHNYDPALWSIEWSKGSKWNAIPKKGLEAVTFHSSRITVRPKVTPDAVDIVKLMDSITPRAIPVAKQGKESKRVLELTLCDLHLNKLAWKGTTGNDFDLDIACNRVTEVVSDIVRRIGAERFSRIILPLGSDLFNSEGSTGTTHGGTPQDEDSRAPKVYARAVELFAGIIEEMRKHSDLVECILTQGNHDYDTSVMFAHTIKAYFRNCLDVVVDTTPMLRKYIKIGKSLLVLGHFDADAKRIKEIIPAEAGDKWGETKYREAHGAHQHIEKCESFAGFKFRRSPSITGRDEWHYQNGFLSEPENASYVWEPDRGLVDTWYWRGAL